MEKQKEITLTSVVNGDENRDVLNIRFICQRVIDDYSELVKKQAEVSVKWEQYQNNIAEMARLGMSDDPDKKEKMRKLREDSRDILDWMKGFDAKKFFEERVRIIQRILSDNKYAGRYSNDFFYDNVDPAEINRFLEACIYKDFDTKKK